MKEGFQGSELKIGTCTTAILGKKKQNKRIRGKWRRENIGLLPDRFKENVTYSLGKSCGRNSSDRRNLMQTNPAN